MRKRKNRDAALIVLKNLILISTLIFSSVAGFSQESRLTSTPSDGKPKIKKTTSVRLAEMRKEPHTFEATAYSLRGRTASGEFVRQGIIAADPRVLPIGTRVRIEGMGTFVVKDTGGAIKGMRIDIWMPSTKNAINFGRRKVKLTVID